MREAKIEGLGLEAGWEYEIPVPAVPRDESEGCTTCAAVSRPRPDAGLMSEAVLVRIRDILQHRCPDDAGNLTQAPSWRLPARHALR